MSTEVRVAGDVRIRGERIVEMARRLEPEAGETVIDAEGLQVLPAGIDPHAHLSPPWADDYESGSKAALAGGIGTVGCMTRVEENETLLGAVQREARRVGAEAIADVVLHPIVSRPHESVENELSELADAGHTSLKVFLVSRAFRDEEGRYEVILRAAGRRGMLSMLHCEDGALLERAEERLRAQRRTSLQAFAESRPVEAEVAAVERAVRLCEDTSAPIYIVHLSSARALDVCRRARARGLPVFVETRPLYLHFTKDRFGTAEGPLFVGQPPLREPEDVDAMWAGLEDGTIDTLGTDHAPWTREQKLDPQLDITRLRPGVAALETMLPVLYSEGVRNNRLSLERFAAVTATNAAKLLGLYPKKGTLEVGSDADLTLWDPDEKRTVRAASLHSRAGYSVHEGWEVTGWPRWTLRRGRIVAEWGRVAGRPGSGELLERGPTLAP